MKSNSLAVRTSVKKSSLLRTPKQDKKGTKCCCIPLLVTFSMLCGDWKNLLHPVYTEVIHFYLEDSTKTKKKVHTMWHWMSELGHQSNQHVIFIRIPSVPSWAETRGWMSFFIEMKGQFLFKRSKLKFRCIYWIWRINLRLVSNCSQLQHVICWKGHEHLLLLIPLGQSSKQKVYFTCQYLHNAHVYRRVHTHTGVGTLYLMSIYSALP